MNKREYLDDTIARSLSPYHLDDIQVPSVGWDVTSDGIVEEENRRCVETLQRNSIERRTCLPKGRD